jgi:hypothetical protein
VRNLSSIGLCDGRAHVVEFTDDVINALVEIEGASRPANKDVEMQDSEPIAAQPTAAPTMQEATHLIPSEMLIEPASSPLTPLPNTQESDGDAMNLDPPNAADSEGATSDDDSMYISSIAAVSG